MSAPGGASGPVEAPLLDRWTRVKGLRLFSRVSETGETGTPPIVHVHGFAISGRYLIPTATRLAARYPTYVPDLPGHGRSQKPPRPLGVRALAAALAGYLDVMDVPRAVVVGNSSGCLVAVELAHRYPERVERAILVSPAGGPHNCPLPRGLVQLARDGLREPIALTSIAMADYLRFGLLNSVRAFRAMTRFPTVERLVAVPVPCLLVVGMRDPLISRPHLTALARSAPNIADVCDLDAAHAINYSRPDALARIIDAYLRGEPLAKVRAHEPAITEITTLHGGETR
jgi:pimeloyl-ACP methyl ester carboxylesterase